MIFYFSGRYCLCSDHIISQGPETIFKEKANVMTSYNYDRKEDITRFKVIWKKRKETVE